MDSSSNFEFQTDGTCGLDDAWSVSPTMTAQLLQLWRPLRVTWLLVVKVVSSTFTQSILVARELSLRARLTTEKTHSSQLWTCIRLLTLYVSTTMVKCWPCQQSAKNTVWKSCMYRLRQSSPTGQRQRHLSTTSGAWTSRQWVNLWQLEMIKANAYSTVSSTTKTV